jgi:hypothetical protein
MKSVTPVVHRRRGDRAILCRPSVYYNARLIVAGDTCARADHRSPGPREIVRGNGQEY